MKSAWKGHASLRNILKDSSDVPLLWIPPGWARLSQPNPEGPPALGGRGHAGRGSPPRGVIGERRPCAVTSCLAASFREERGSGAPGRCGTCRQVLARLLRGNAAVSPRLRCSAERASGPRLSGAAVGRGARVALILQRSQGLPRGEAPPGRAVWPAPRRHRALLTPYRSGSQPRGGGRPPRRG